MVLAVLISIKGWVDTTDNSLAPFNGANELWKLQDLESAVIGVTYIRYRTPIFHDTGEEFAVIRSDLWRSNYTKTITRELMSCLGSQACEVCGRACRAKPQTLTRLCFFLLTCATICFLAPHCKDKKTDAELT